MSITITNFRNPAWEDKLNLELNTYLDIHTGHHVVQSEGFYAFYETQLVGGITYIKTAPKNIWIEGLYVDANFRRQKIGTQLVDKVINSGKECIASHLQLNTFFPEARDFFKACKFDEVATIPNWKYGLTGYFMTKNI
ncbi:MAG: GNAT family N-acetyltransferase [Alphaproteobacteria bacterium]|nr:GNAT family N-acetyltransferase [Alphaproteobacteria bacterium]